MMTIILSILCAFFFFLSLFLIYRLGVHKMAIEGLVEIIQANIEAVEAEKEIADKLTDTKEKLQDIEDTVNEMSATKSYYQGRYDAYEEWEQHPETFYPNAICHYPNACAAAANRIKELLERRPVRGVSVDCMITICKTEECKAWLNDDRDMQEKLQHKPSYYEDMMTE